jgi:hypothetical protein
VIPPEDGAEPRSWAQKEGPCLQPPASGSQRLNVCDGPNGKQLSEPNERNELEIRPRFPHFHSQISYS